MNAERKQNAWQQSFWFLLWTGVLFGGFYHDCFKVFGERRSDHIGAESYLTLNRMALVERSNVNPFTPLVVGIQNVQEAGSPYQIYSSQFGLSGIVLAALATFTGANKIHLALFATQLVTLFTSGLIAAFLVSVGKQTGHLATGIATLLLATSTFLLVHVSSLFWCNCLMFAPFTLTWLFGGRLLESRKGNLCLIGMYFILCNLKSLCGYEYITTMVLSPLPALVFHDHQANRLAWKRIWIYGVFVAAGCSGFALAILMHMAQLKYVMGMDPVETILNRARYRLGQDKIQSEIIHTPGVKPFAFLSDRNWYSIHAFWSYFTLPAFKLSRWDWVCPVWMISACAASVGLLTACRWTKLSRFTQGLLLAFLVSIPTSLSWQIAARNHMEVHINLNLQVFYVPFLMFAYILVGLGIQFLALQLLIPVRAIAKIVLRNIGNSANWDFPQRYRWLVGALLVLLVIGSWYWKSRNTLETHVTNALNRAMASPSESVPCRFHIEQVCDDKTPVWFFEMQRSTLPTLYPNVGEGELTISGWVLDERNPTNPVFLAVVCGDQLLGITHTGLPRPDVAQTTGIDSPSAGFTLRVKHPLDSDKPCRLFAIPAYDRAYELPLPLDRVATGTLPGTIGGL